MDMNVSPSVDFEDASNPSMDQKILPVSSLKNDWILPPAPVQMADIEEKAESDALVEQIEEIAEVEMDTEFEALVELLNSIQSEDLRLYDDTELRLPENISTYGGSEVSLDMSPPRFKNSSSNVRQDSSNLAGLKIVSSE
jgi:hypothetical protein